MVGQLAVRSGALLQQEHGGVDLRAGREPAGGQRQHESPQQRPVHLAGRAEASCQSVVGPGIELRLPLRADRQLRTRRRAPVELRSAELSPAGDLVVSDDQQADVRSRQHVAHLRLPDDSDRGSAARHRSDLCLGVDGIHGQRRPSAWQFPVSLVGRRVAVRPQDLEAVESALRRLVRHRIARAEGGTAGDGRVAALLPGAERDHGLHFLERRAVLDHAVGHTAARRGAVEGEPGSVRAGSVDDQTADAEPRAPLRLLERRSTRDQPAGGRVRARAPLRRDPVLALLVGH